MDIFSLGRVFAFTLGGGHLKFKDLMAYLSRFSTSHCLINANELLGRRREEAIQLISMMVSEEACSRPSALEVMNDQYFC